MYTQDAAVREDGTAVGAAGMEDSNLAAMLVDRAVLRRLNLTDLHVAASKGVASVKDCLQSLNAAQAADAVARADILGRTPIFFVILFDATQCLQHLLP